jgi:hypothetical protein
LLGGIFLHTSSSGSPASQPWKPCIAKGASKGTLILPGWALSRSIAGTRLRYSSLGSFALVRGTIGAPSLSRMIAIATAQRRDRC